MKKVCTNCQRFAGENENFCNLCGGKLTTIADTPSPEPVRQAPPAYQAQKPRQVFQFDAQAEKAKSRGITSAILGGFGLFFSFIWFASPVGMILSIVGLCFSSTSKKLGYTGGSRRAGKGLSIAGIIISSLIILFTIFLFVLFLIGDAQHHTTIDRIPGMFGTFDTIPDIKSV